MYFTLVHVCIVVSAIYEAHILAFVRGTGSAEGIDLDPVGLTRFESRSV